MFLNYNIMTTFTNFKTSDKDTLLFDVNNCNSSLVNSIRRTIITEVETISFNTEDYINSDIKIIKNTTSLHNQFILHRMGLIPVFSKNISEYNPDKYKFTINKSNNTQNVIDITTDDIEILNLETNKPEQNDDFFPRNSITNDKILITKLKPNPNKEGDTFWFKAIVQLDETVKFHDINWPSHIKLTPAQITAKLKIPKSLMDIATNLLNETETYSKMTKVFEEAKAKINTCEI